MPQGILIRLQNFIFFLRDILLQLHDDNDFLFNIFSYSSSKAKSSSLISNSMNDYEAKYKVI